MPRPIRLSDDLIRLRADEIRQLGVFQGSPIYFGANRPPKGAIAFTKAVAKRLRCSQTLVKRVLTGLPRSGTRRSPENRLKAVIHNGDVGAYRDFALRLADMVRLDRSIDGAHVLEALINEATPLPARLDILYDFIERRHLTVPGSPDLIRGAERHYWRDARSVQSTSVKPVHKALRPEIIIREALVDALDASLSTDGCLDSRTRPLVLALRDSLQK